MKKFLISVSFFLVFSQQAAFAEQEYEEQVDRLVKVTEETARNLTRDSLKGYAQKLAENVELPPEAQSLIAIEILEFMMIELFENPELKKLKYQLYREHFDLSEMKSLVDFYESSLGQKMLTDFPVIMQKAQERVPTVMDGMYERLENSFDEIVEKVRTEHDW